jgi:PHD/YefM family antitoxin component YafN of YafNO toxin-antitoxin module
MTQQNRRPTLFENMVSITEFNKGHGSKIIEEVKRTGYKIILKNNHPEAVLITPQQFEVLLAASEQLADLATNLQALTRLASMDPNQVMTTAQVLRQLLISKSELDESIQTSPE